MWRSLAEDAVHRLNKEALKYMYLVYWQGEASRTSEEVDKLPTGHRCLQSCVGTRARLGYVGFDAQLQCILSLHCTLYVRPCVRKHVYAIYIVVWKHAVCLRVRSL